MNLFLLFISQIVAVQIDFDVGVTEKDENKNAGNPVTSGNLMPEVILKTFLESTTQKSGPEKSGGGFFLFLDYFLQNRRYFTP